MNLLRPVQIEDLLRREPVQIDLERLGALMADRTVLVTGAGGSIGSELCRQLIRFGPARLVLLGHGENSIFTIHSELEERWPGRGTLVPVIADIRDGRGCSRSSANTGPRSSSSRGAQARAAHGGERPARP